MYFLILCFIVCIILRHNDKKKQKEEEKEKKKKQEEEKKKKQEEEKEKQKKYEENIRMATGDIPKAVNNQLTELDLEIEKKGMESIRLYESDPKLGKLKEFLESVYKVIDNHNCNVIACSEEIFEICKNYYTRYTIYCLTQNNGKGIVFSGKEYISGSSLDIDFESFSCVCCVLIRQKFPGRFVIARDKIKIREIDLYNDSKEPVFAYGHVMMSQGLLSLYLPDYINEDVEKYKRELRQKENEAELHRRERGDDIPM